MQAILTNPGRDMAMALRLLEYEDQWRALRRRGVAEPEALRRLAETALYLPEDQARMLAR